MSPGDDDELLGRLQHFFSRFFLKKNVLLSRCGMAAGHVWTGCSRLLHDLFPFEFLFLAMDVLFEFFAGFLLGRFTGKFTSWTIPLGSDIFSVSVESIMHRRVERRIRFGTRTSFKMNHFESDLRGRDIGRRLRLNGNLSGHSIFKQFKSPLIFNPISI